MRKFVPPTNEMETLQDLDNAEQVIRQKLRSVELLGEIPVSEEHLFSMSRVLGRVGLQSRVRWPNCMAVALVGIAQYQYDGDAYWPHVKSAFGLTSLLAREQQALGRWFEDYLECNGLRRFRHLVEEGALRYLTPILAHALIPRALVPEYMKLVVWPAVTNPSRHGASGAEIQQRLASRVPVPGMPRSLYRFIVHGGGVARDITDRALELASAAARGERPRVGLPSWLENEIVSWVEKLSLAEREHAKPETRRRALRPLLKFDPTYCRVLVELPYPDDASTVWEVILLPGNRKHVEPWKEPWQRTGPATVTIDEPFSTLSVSLQSSREKAIEGTFPGLTPDQPAMFFDSRSCQVVGSNRVVPGVGWYILAPKAAEFFADQQAIQPSEDLGPPLGTWPDIAASYVEVPKGTQVLTVRVGPRAIQYRLEDAPAAAQLDVPELSPPLAPAGHDVLAIETRLPTILLPPLGPSPGLAEKDRWQIRALADDGTDSGWRSPDELQPSVEPDGSVRLRLEPLIPGVDVGTWDITVRGPIGRGLSARLSLLPEMNLHVEEVTGVAGPELPEARVIVMTGDHIRVLEQGDVAEVCPQGWVLRDRNRNGRIPFSVRDSRTGREAAATIQLPVVEWRWVGRDVAGQPNMAEQFSLQALEARTAPQLFASHPQGARVRLRLVDPGGRVLQERLSFAGPKRGAVFHLVEFLATAQESAAASVHFRLELLSPQGEVSGAAMVAALTHDLQPEDVRVDSKQSGTDISWRLPRPVSGLRAVVGSLSRPWEPPLDPCPAELHQDGRYRVTTPVLLPGRYQLTLGRDDGWVGWQPVGPPVQFWVGTVFERRTRSRLLPPTVQGRVERLLLLETPELRAEELSKLLTGIGSHQLGELLSMIGQAMRHGPCEELLGLNWPGVAPGAVRFQESQLTPVLEALADSVRCGTTWSSHRASRRALVALGIDRLPPPSKEGLDSSLAASIWQVWEPLGAFVDLHRAPYDSEARQRCQEYLGWSPVFVYTCEKCGDKGEEAICPSCSTGKRRRYIQDFPIIGDVNGPDFELDAIRLGAMRAVLLPGPCQQLATDGWVVTCLETLEALSDCSDDKLIWKRDRIISMYRPMASFLELEISRHLSRVRNLPRNVHPGQYPWAYVTRVSLPLGVRYPSFAGYRTHQAPLCSWYREK